MQGAGTPRRPMPQPARGLTAFPLKVLAIVAMTANHSCYIYWPYLPDIARCALFALGGLTFPIMAFLLVEGYRHTSSLKRYAQRMLAFALVAQAPFMLFLSPSGNVLFTLLIGLGVLWAHDTLHGAARVGAIAALVALSAPCDWGILGPVMVLILHVVADRCKRVAYSALIPITANGLPTAAAFAAAPTLANLAFALYPLVGCTATIPLLISYNGGRGRPLKWFFYAYYPAHIAVLGLAKGLLLGDWSLDYPM